MTAFKVGPQCFRLYTKKQVGSEEMSNVLELHSWGTLLRWFAHLFSIIWIISPPMGQSDKCLKLFSFIN